MNMECKELFAIFEKVGGKFICNYKDNTGLMLPQNIKCTKLHRANYGLDKFIFSHSMVYQDIFTEKKYHLGTNRLNKFIIIKIYL